MLCAQQQELIEDADADVTAACGARCASSCHPRDPLYLFACHLEWRDRRNIKAYEELVAALDDCNEEIRAVAETLLHRSSPRPHRSSEELHSERDDLPERDLIASDAGYPAEVRSAGAVPVNHARKV